MVNKAEALKRLGELDDACRHYESMERRRYRRRRRLHNDLEYFASVIFGSLGCAGLLVSGAIINTNSSYSLITALSGGVLTFFFFLNAGKKLKGGDDYERT